MNTLLTGPGRWIKFVVCVVVIATLGALYAARIEDRPGGWLRCIEAPLAHDGAALTLPLFTVARVDEGGYLLHKADQAVPVVGDTGGLERGLTVSVMGHFRAADGVLVVDPASGGWRVDHPLRPAKQALGLVGLALGLLLLPVGFRLRRDGIVSRG